VSVVRSPNVVNWRKRGCAPRGKIALPFCQLARNVSGVIGDVGFDDSVRAS
jgi:hypothetical protein